MNEETKKMIKALTALYVAAAEELLSETPGQVLVLVFDDTGMIETGFGCRACAAEAAQVYADLHQDEDHIGEGEKVH